MPTKLRKPQPETAVKAPAPARGSADEMYPMLLADTARGCNLLEVNGKC